MAANAGQDLSIIRSMVGHANIQMTEHYTHYSLDSKRQVIESLPLPTAKKLIQTTLFAETISHLPVTKLPHLAATLENLLTADQQKELMRQLR